MRPSRVSLVTAAAAMLLALPACSGQNASDSASPDQNGAAGAAASGTPSAVIATAPSLASAEPPTKGCAAMDKAFAALLTDSEPGKAFTAAVESRGSSQDQWLAFVSYLGGEGRATLAASAAGDSQAEEALAAVDTYARLAPDVLGGKIQEFADPQKAQDDLAAGREPEVRPEYTQAVDEMTQAHTTISVCLPSWPVVF